MISITDYIYMKAQNLKEKLGKGSSLCSCRSLRFNGGNLPDYTNELLQDVYAMRYSLAYAYEYKEIYQKLLERMTLGRMLEVTSIGCGNMVDYWSLKHALPGECHVRYHGVDVIDWNDKFAACDGDHIDFAKQKITDYLSECDALNSDVYVLPKSISEINDDEIETICRTIGEKGFTKNEVHFLFSMRAYKDNLKDDKSKAKKICEAIMELGMAPDADNGIVYEGENKKIYYSDRDFWIGKLMNGTYDMLYNFPMLCENYTKGICSCAMCNNNTNRPMLNAMYMRYQIFTFRKVA